VDIIPFMTQSLIPKAEDIVTDQSRACKLVES
jgi:hypothetical protein